MVYLDNAATTRPLDSVAAAVHAALTESWANPSSAHRAGLAARTEVDRAREIIAHYCGIATAGVVFTSGGTEANHLAVLGLPLRSATTHIVSSQAEHPSLARAIAARPGATALQVRLLATGAVDLAHLESLLDERVGLVALFEGHNETGARNPIAEIVACVRQRAPRALIHLDSVQAFGKPTPPPFSLGIDSAAVSAHKVHGPKGVGALLLQTRTQLVPQLAGGGQEGDRRSGTENVPGIAGFGAAVAALAACPPLVHQELRRRRDQLASTLVERIPGTRILGTGGATLPHIVTAVLPGVRAEAVLHHLERAGVIASAGAACHSGSHQLSAALLAVGLVEAEIRSVLRLSLARDTTDREIEQVVEILPRIVADLARLGATR